MLLGVALALTRPLLTLAGLFAIRYLFDGVTGAFGSRRADDLVRPLVLFAAIAIGTLVLNALGAFLLRIAQAGFDHRAEEAILRALNAPADLAYLDDSAFHDRAALARDSGRSALTQVLNTLTGLVGNGASVFATAVLLARVDAWVCIAVVGSLLPAMFLEHRAAIATFRLAQLHAEVQRRHHYWREFLTDRRHAPELRLFGHVEWVLGHWNRSWAALTRARQRLDARNVIGVLAGGIVATTGVCAAYALVAIAGIQGRISVGELAMFFGAIDATSGSVRALISQLASVDVTSHRLGTYFRILDDEAKEHGRPRLPCPDALASGISLIRLGLRYPGTTRFAIRAVTAHLDIGGCYAIVGANGSGKSTLVRALTGLYPFEEGDIRFDKTSIREMDLASLRGHCACLLQDFGRYEISVRDNVLLGDADGEDAVRIREQLHSAGLDSVLDRLPQREATLLGTSFPGGCELSGGEWQRLALARVMRREALLTILDEPTAHLDSDSECRLLSELLTPVPGRIVIVVTHRLQLVEATDQVLFMRAGKLVAQGTHHELMRREEGYRAMRLGMATTGTADSVAVRSPA